MKVSIDFGSNHGAVDALLALARDLVSGTAIEELVITASDDGPLVPTAVVTTVQAGHRQTDEFVWSDGDWRLIGF